MPSLKNSIQILSVVPLFFMAACGDNGSWTMQPYNGTPYGDRTAGHGVEYVLAKMAPEAGASTDQAAAPEDQSAMKPAAAAAEEKPADAQPATAAGAAPAAPAAPAAAAAPTPAPQPATASAEKNSAASATNADAMFNKKQSK